jgi:hypothetical protein
MPAILVPMALCALLLASALASAVQEAAVPRPPSKDPVVARGKNGLELKRSELEEALLERFGLSQTGRELLDLLLKSRLLEQLARENGLTVSDADVARRWDELEKRARAAGEKGGLAGEIEESGLSQSQFREFLRLSLVQERLTRAALGLDPSAEVPGEKQEIWLEQELARRGFEILPPPWKDAAGSAGIVARCGDVVIARDDFASFLAARLPREDVRETCWHLLLLAAIERRMPDLAPRALERAIDAEIERRRARHALEYPAITFEQRLGATGKTLELLRREPSVRIAALTRLWVDRTAGPEGLRQAYEKERALFEGRFGEAVRAHMLFRVAGRFVNDLCPRTFEDAEDELEEFGQRARSLDEFTALVERFSEEHSTKKQKGELGWVTRADPRVPAAISAAIFDLRDSGGKIPPGGRLVGPVRLDSGAALLWVSELRATPSWEEMAEHVHEELRRRFVEELLPRGELELLLGGA